MAEIKSLFCQKLEKSFLTSVCGPGINWSSNLTWVQIQQPGNFGYSVPAARMSSPQTEFRPTLFTSLPFPDTGCGGEGTMMQDGCKTPWTKATHTYLQSVCQLLSHTHIRAYIIWLGLTNLLLTSQLTCWKMLYLDDMLQLNCKADRVSGWGNTGYSRKVGGTFERNLTNTHKKCYKNWPNYYEVSRTKQL